MDRALFVFRCLCLLVSFPLLFWWNVWNSFLLGVFQSFNYFDIPKSSETRTFTRLHTHKAKKKKKIRNAMQQPLHGPSADGPKEKFPFLISLSRKASSFLQVNHRLIFVPASEKERENRRGLRNETREERRMIVKRSRHLVHNLTLFFSTYTWRNIDIGNLRNLCYPPTSFSIFTQEAIRVHHSLGLFYFQLYDSFSSSLWTW